MKRRLWTVVAAAASVAALAVVPSALAAYTTAKLEVRQTGNAVTVKATLSPDDDPTASVRIHTPAGTEVTTNQAPGASLGTVSAFVKAADLANADLPVTGQLLMAAPGQVPAAVQQQCIGTATPIATWLLSLGAGGTTLAPVPAYVIAPAAGLGLGPYVQICLPPPDVPLGTPGRATLGVKLYSAELTITGVFSRPTSTAAWLAFWTPYQPGVGQVNVAGTVASPAGVASGAVTVSARRRGAGATVSGRVLQGGTARGGVGVTIFGGPRANRLRRLTRVQSRANGTFSFRARSGIFFRANALATSAPAPTICSTMSPRLAPVPCVNPTINGFTATSRVVRKR